MSFHPRNSIRVIYPGETPAHVLPGDTNKFTEHGIVHNRKNGTAENVYEQESE